MVPSTFHLYSLMLFLLSCQQPSLSFVLNQPSTSLPSSYSSTTTKRHQQQYLFLDQFNEGEYSQEVIESSRTNQWGIPSSETLPPFSNTPMEQLENGGRITLVGSGPGDPELLTMKAVNLLRGKDTLVIVDRLVSQEIVDLIEGEIKVARKLPGCAELAQEEIYWWAHQGLAAGKHVIRLKIGDPFVFGRGGEEVLKFRKFGVESKVIPVCVTEYFMNVFF
jgi:hypothetical protein